MKATQEQVETLANALAPHVDAIRMYGAVNGLTPRRVRWDAFWAIPSAVRGAFTASVYGNGGNDEHIDTALRRVMVRLGLGQFSA